MKHLKFYTGVPDVQDDPIILCPGVAYIKNKDEVRFLKDYRRKATVAIDSSNPAMDEEVKVLRRFIIGSSKLGSQRVITNYEGGTTSDDGEYTYYKYFKLGSSELGSNRIMTE